MKLRVGAGMNARGRRVDLRFGDFACSVQGFDDPVEPLVRLVRELGMALADGASGLGRPLFDEATLRRLEAEIAGACAEGAVSALPGLVVTTGEADRTAGGPAEARSMAAPGGEARDLSPEAAADPGANGGVADPDRAAPETLGAAAERHVAEPDVAEPDALDPDAVERELRAALSLSSDPGPLATDEADEPEDVFARPKDTAGDKREDPAVAGINLFAEDPAAEAAEEPEPDAWEEPAPGADPEPGRPDPPDPKAWQEPPRPSAEPQTGDLPKAANLFEPAAEEDTAGEAGANLFLENRPDHHGEPQAGVAAEGLKQAAEVKEVGSARPNLFLAEGPDGAGQREAGAGRRSPGDVLEDEGPSGGSGDRDPDRFGRARLRTVEGSAPPRQAVLSVADLARRAGAEAPPDLIAASAAWLVVVQGQHSFTRREVLEVFDEIPGDHPNGGEARVKGFGKLVRNGQVKLGADDRFRLSDAERDRFELLLD